MKMTIQQAVLSSAAKALRPVIRLCLRHGLSEAPISDLIRKLFVSEATAQLVRADQKQTVSAIASLTGLSRKEVSRLQDFGTDQLLHESRKRDRVARVLSGWVNDRDFSGTAGDRVLPLNGSHGSFAHLVKRYGGDVTPTAMLKLLDSAGNAELLSDDRVRILSEAYIPTATPLESLEIFGTDGGELLDTIEFNIHTDIANRRFQRKVSNGRVAPDALARFRSITERDAMALLERLDAWLAENEQPDELKSPTAYVAVGIYFYEKHSEKDHG